MSLSSKPSVELGALDLVDSSLKIGEHTVLYMPCSTQADQRVPLPINFNVIERTYLRSLDEGIILGASYIVTPAFSELDDTDKSELNVKLFRVLCAVLHSLDQGLRLAGSEEVLPVPDMTNIACIPFSEDIEKFSAVPLLLKIELRNYDPVQHDRGFHQRLNLLVKESLQFGSIPANTKELVTISKTAWQDPLVEDLSGTSQQCGEEWEQMVVLEMPKMSSPSCISKPKLHMEVSSLLKVLNDDKTLPILERLEVPKQLKEKQLPHVSFPYSVLLFSKEALIPLDSAH
ncbi:hypothetical protein HAX54_037421 [Datura stramonium]|uniref:Uncharacterized protein n=1 Tax=Datura stramonium TaxID=4076 RepID=A0ABS8SGW2_DATST|nr:hypothetical protein [Datura stramonium]